MGLHNAILISALALLCMPAAAQKRTTAHPRETVEAPDVLKEAEELLQKQQYDLAEAKLKTIVTTDAANPQAWFDLGFAESHLAKSPDAIAAYRKAVELSPKWFEAQLNLGLQLAKAGQNAEAASVLRIAVQLKPSTGGQRALATAWLLLAQTLEASDPKSAGGAYDKAIEFDPANADLYVVAGSVAERNGDLAGAEQRYLKAAELGNSAGTGQLVDLYIKQKRYADAETWLRKFLALNPQNAAAQAQLGRLLAAEGKLPEAIASLEAAGTAGATRELGGLYLENKQYDKAATVFQGLLGRNPEDAELHLGLGMAMEHLHKYPEAEAELIQALQRKPELTDAYYDLAYAAQQNKHYQLSLRALDARAKFLPEIAGTYWLRAIDFDSLHANKQAAANYRLFLAVSNGKSPDQEFQARHRLIAITPQ
ncbi:MAG TPA: tetratricopeptide repeat protein [Candidatus Angelobacter sp.]|nr:tetratricopeptide repeat protein [Candidatus Angelobacter sp.]